jgi:hypothetical protein
MKKNLKSYLKRLQELNKEYENQLAIIKVEMEIDGIKLYRKKSKRG